MKDNRLRKRQPKKPKMSFADYKKQVEECLRTNENCTEEEVEYVMNAIWEEPMGSGAKDAEEELLMCYEEGLPPATTAQILAA
jgi:hypothetical protein